MSKTHPAAPLYRQVDDRIQYNQTALKNLTETGWTVIRFDKTDATRVHRIINLLRHRLNTVWDVYHASGNHIIIKSSLEKKVEKIINENMPTKHVFIRPNANKTATIDIAFYTDNRNINDFFKGNEKLLIDYFDTEAQKALGYLDCSHKRNPRLGITGTKPVEYTLAYNINKHQISTKIKETGKPYVVFQCYKK